MSLEGDRMRPRPIWHDTGPVLRSDAAFPPVADVAVAGAGLAGIATALMLARAGHRVVVMDAARAGARTTGASTAKLSVLQGTVYQKLRRSHGDAAVAAYAQAQLVAQRWLRTELADARDAIWPQSAYTYATTRAGAAALEAEADAMATGHVPADRLAAGEIGLPFPVAGALHMRGQAQLHPVRVLAHLIAQAQAAGVTFVDGCRMLGVRTSASSVNVETGRGRIRADHLVATTGFPAIDRAMFFATLVPSRQFVGAYRLPIGAPMPEGMFLSADPVTRSLRMASDVDGEPMLLVGGDSFFPGRVDTTQVLDDLDRWVNGAFSGAQRVQWWAAQDYTRVDHRPFFGVVPATHGRVLAATGFAKWGMTNAVAGALALAGCIAGEPPIWGWAFDDAGVSGRGVREGLGAFGAVSRQLVGGWVNPREHHAESGARARVIRRHGRPVAESIVGSRHCAVSAVCTHMGGVLRWNAAERSWDCPLHASRFAPDGRVLEGPATRDLPPVSRARPTMPHTEKENTMTDPRPPEEIEPVFLDPDLSSDEQDDEAEEDEDHDGEDDDTRAPA